MHSNRRLPSKSSALKKLTAAVASALVLSSAAHAAGLGKLTVLSSLGQPLRAEIELTSVSPEEAAGLVAKLASPDAFKSANIEFNPSLLTLRFNVEQRGGRQFIRVSSTQPMNEPFVDLLLEMTWNNGRLVREYTFLLDPAELRATQSAQLAAGSAARPRSEPAERARLESAARPAAERPASERAASSTRAASDTPASAGRAGDAPASAGASEYRVKKGDSLGKIAGQLKPVEVSLDMMLVALYRANPDAFVGNNMNRLKSGRILSVPAADAIGAIGEGEAHGVVVAHAADFNAYRNKLAGQVGAGEAEKTPRATQSGTGKVSAKVEERPTAANESQDQLRLSKAAPKAAAGKAASTEDVIARQRQQEESQARVKELERNVNDLEKLAKVKSKAGADAQSIAAASIAPAAPVAPVAPATPAEAPAATETPPAPVVQAQPEVKKPAPIRPAIKTASPVPEPGLLDFIMDNLTYLAVGAAALLAGAFAIAQRRKKQNSSSLLDEPSIMGVPNEPTHSMFAETGGQSVDTNNSVFNSSFAPSASQLDTNEVDPVAEADVYIAYGRDLQAEEILKEALRTHPERMPVRLKLLEIYAARKDQRAFETQAGELYGMTRGQGDEWAQAAALGKSIDPQNPLYANGGGGAALGAAAVGAGVGTAVGAGMAGAAVAASHNDLLSKDLDDAFLAADADAHAFSGAAAPASFDQHFADAMHTAQPAVQPVAAPAAPAAAPAAEHAEDDNLLDFDLGGLAFDPVTPADQTALPTPDVKDIAAHGENELDFDMGGFDPAPAAAAAAPAPAPVTSAPAPAAAEAPLDFSFDMDFGATPAPNPVPQMEAHPNDDPVHGFGAPTPAPNADIDMADLARAFDLPGTVPAAPAAKEAEFDLDNMDFGLDDEPAAAALPTMGLEDDPFALPTATPAVAESAAFAPHDMLEPHLAAPSFDLDLADASLADSPLVESHDAAPAAAEGEMSPAHMEMETKLDLALAYQEIGDKEGARELLDEVIKGGTSEQAGRANTMRSALA